MSVINFASVKGMTENPQENREGSAPVFNNDKKSSEFRSLLEQVLSAERDVSSGKKIPQGVFSENSSRKEAFSSALPDLPASSHLPKNHSVKKGIVQHRYFPHQKSSVKAGLERFAEVADNFPQSNFGSSNIPQTSYAQDGSLHVTKNGLAPPKKHYQGEEKFSKSFKNPPLKIIQGNSKKLKEGFTDSFYPTPSGGEKIIHGFNDIKKEQNLRKITNQLNLLPQLKNNLGEQVDLDNRLSRRSGFFEDIGQVGSTKKDAFPKDGIKIDHLVSARKMGIDYPRPEGDVKIDNPGFGGKMRFDYPESEGEMKIDNPGLGGKMKFGHPEPEGDVKIDNPGPRGKMRFDYPESEGDVKIDNPGFGGKVEFGHPESKGEVKIDNPTPKGLEALREILADKRFANVDNLEPHYSDGKKGLPTDILKINVNNGVFEGIHVLNLDGLDIANPSTLLNRITDYIIQNKIKNLKNLDIIVNHNDLGQFKISAQKANMGNQVNLTIETTTPEAALFFNDHESDLVKNLIQSGVKLFDVKILRHTEGKNLSNSLNYSFENNSSGFEMNEQGSNSSQERSQRQDTQRRYQLWREFAENANSGDF